MPTESCVSRFPDKLNRLDTDVMVQSGNGTNRQQQTEDGVY